MSKRIAIPVNNGILSQHFGHCKQFAIVETTNSNITKESFVDAPPHQPGLLPNWLAERGVTDIIAGGIGHKAIELFNHKNINVFSGAPEADYKNIVEGFLNNTLEFSSNYCDH